MEDIDFIPWSIRDASRFCILTSQYIVLKGLKIDQVLPINHEESREDPPGVADVWQLLWSTIEASLHRLPLAQPGPEFIPINQALITENL